MSEIHEAIEKAQEGEHGEGFNRRIALVIAILALFLSFSETLGKGAQTEVVTKNIEASDLWSFFQAKDIRRTVVNVAADQTGLLAAGLADPAAKAAADKQIETWRHTAERYESDPKAGNGRKELEEKAKTAEEERDLSTAKYHHYELASAAFQIGIVLASAAVITGMVVLAWFAGALGVVGAVAVGARSIRAACGAADRVVVNNVIARSVSDEAIQIEASAGLLRGACHRAGHFGPDPLARNDDDQILIARLSTASAASLTASVSVGWAWQVRAISSDVRRTPWPPRPRRSGCRRRGRGCGRPARRSVLASARIFTSPSVSSGTLARPLAGEREFADLVLDAGCLELLLGLADAGHLRQRVNDAGDRRRN